MRSDRLAATVVGALAAILTVYWFTLLARRAEAAHARREAAGATAPTDAAEIRILRLDRGAAPEALAQGWSSQEPGAGVWSLGRTAVLQFQGVGPDRVVDVELSLRPFVRPPQLPAQNITVTAGERRLAAWRLTRPDVVTLHLNVPPEARRPDGVIELRFDLPNAASPARLARGEGDPRVIAVQLTKIVISD